MVAINFDLIARDRASNVAGKVGSSFQRAGGQISKMHGHVSKMARSGIVELGAFAGVAGVGAVLKASTDLEQKYSKTMALVKASTNTPQSSMKALDALAMKMGAQTQFSANQAADAMLELGKAGISTSDIMGGGLKNTLLLASAGGLDLGNAATIASNAMNTFNLRGRDMGKIAAALAGGANASSASVESLGQGLSQVGPGARNAGLNLQQTVGVLSAFDAAGIKGSDAGTSLKTMLTRLVPSTKQARTEMSALGLDFTKADGSFDSITTVAQKLHDKLGPLTAAQRTQALQTMFGSDATRAATVLMNQGSDGLAKYIKATRDQGAAQKMANAAMSGTSGAMERLHGSVETAELAIGKALAPTVVKVANYLSTKAVPAVTAFINQMQSGTGNGGKLVSDVKAIGSALTPVVHTVLDLVKAFDSLPGGVKKAVGVGAGAAYVASKIPGMPSLTKAAASVVTKSVTGGVQKVYVVNAGFGGAAGAAGVAGTAASIANTATKFITKGLVVGVGVAVADSLSKTLSRIGTPGKEGGVLSPFDKSKSKTNSLLFGPGHTVKADAQNALTAATGHRSVGQMLSGPFGAGGGDVAKSVKNFKALDATLARLNYKHPTAGAAAYEKVLKASGLSAGDLNKVLPKTAFQMNATAHGGKTGAAAFRELFRDSVNASKAMRLLPKNVRTAVSAPGAVKSIGDIQKLATRYKLTPKQVRTLAQLTDHASGTIRTVNGRLVKLGNSKATPSVTVNGGQATGTLSHISGMMGGLHNKTVTFTTIHRDVRVGGGKGVSANPTHNALGGAIRGAGTGTSDSIPAMLSNNEHVWTAREVAAAGGHEAVAAMRSQVLGGAAVRLAKGGHAKGSGLHVVGHRNLHLSDAGADLLDDLVKNIDHGRVRLGKALGKITDEISKQSDRIKSLKSGRSQFAAGFQGFRTSVFGADFGDTPVTTGGILAMAKQQQLQAQTLQTDVGKVLGKGLSKALITQFQAQGETGVSKLHALAGASASDISRLNAMDRATTASLASAGNQAAGRVYDDRIAAAQQAKALAVHLEHAIERAYAKQAKHGQVEFMLRGDTLIGVIKASNKKHGKKTAGL